MADRLTDKSAITATLSSSDLLHIVDVSDTTDDAAGSSFKMSLLKLLTFIFSVDTYTAYASGGQANATPLICYDNNIATVATTGDSAKLLSATKHARQIVRNNGANAANIYPQTSQQIDSLGVNAPYSIAAGNIVEFVCFVDGTFKST